MSEPNLESEEFINILYELIIKYEGHHEGEVVKKQIVRSEPYKKLAKYIQDTK